MRTVIVGNRALARHVLSFCLDSGWNVVGVVTPEGSTARRQANFASMADLVSDEDAPVLETVDINDESTAERLEELAPDVCICPGWGQIIDERVLGIPDDGFFGFHASRLPEGRGGAPVNWSIIHGASEVWLSFFYYTPGVDAGDVVSQRSVPIAERDDVATVFDALAVAARDILDDIRPSLERGDVDATRQDISDATYRPRRQPQDGLVDWTRSPREQIDWVRAQTRPYPGAYTFSDGTLLRVWRGRPVAEGTSDGKPGEVLAITNGGIDVASGDGVFRIERLQPDRGPPQWADVYARDNEITAGTRFGRHHAPDEWTYTGVRGPDGGTVYDTNLDVGAAGVTTLLCHTSTRRRVAVRVTFDGETLFEDSETVLGTYERPVRYEHSTPGTHTLKTTFAIDGDQVDTRYLKVFVHD